VGGDGSRQIARVVPARPEPEREQPGHARVRDREVVVAPLERGDLRVGRVPGLAAALLQRRGLGHQEQLLRRGGATLERRQLRLDVGEWAAVPVEAHPVDVRGNPQRVRDLGPGLDHHHRRRRMRLLDRRRSRRDVSRRCTAELRLVEQVERADPADPRADRVRQAQPALAVVRVEPARRAAGLVAAGEELVARRDDAAGRLAAVEHLGPVAVDVADLDPVEVRAVRDLGEMVPAGRCDPGGEVPEVAQLPGGGSGRQQREREDEQGEAAGRHAPTA
jgi:hypothetical protein